MKRISKRKIKIDKTDKTEKIDKRGLKRNEEEKTEPTDKKSIEKLDIEKLKKEKKEKWNRFEHIMNDFQEKISKFKTDYFKAKEKTETEKSNK